MEGREKGRKEERHFEQRLEDRELDAEVFRIYPQTNVLYSQHKILLHYKVNIVSNYSEASARQGLEV